MSGFTARWVQVSSDFAAKWVELKARTKKEPFDFQLFGFWNWISGHGLIVAFESIPALQNKVGYPL